MTQIQLDIMMQRLQRADELNQQIARLGSNIKVLNAEMSPMPGEKDLMVRHKLMSILPIQALPENPTDDEIIELGEFLQQMYTKRIAQLKAELETI